MNTLPCIVCKNALESVFNDIPIGMVNPIQDGVACKTEGNYGSSVFDPIGSGETLFFNICDGCLKYAIDNAQVTRKYKRTVTYYD